MIYIIININNFKLYYEENVIIMNNIKSETKHFVQYNHINEDRCDCNYYKEKLRRN